MKMYRDDIPDWLQTALVVFGVIGVCWFVLSAGSKSPVPPSPPEVIHPAKNLEGYCASAIVRCVARVQVKLEIAGSDGCPDDKARKRIEAELANPLEKEDCKSASLHLSENCPNNCSLVNSPPLMVPGPLVFRSDASPNESGLCVADGEVSVTLRGRCRKNQK